MSLFKNNPKMLLSLVICLILFAFIMMFSIFDEAPAADFKPTLVKAHAISVLLLMICFYLMSFYTRRASISFLCTFLCLFAAILNLEGVWVSGLSIMIFYGSLFLAGLFLIHTMILGVQSAIKYFRRPS